MFRTGIAASLVALLLHGTPVWAQEERLFAVGPTSLTAIDTSPERLGLAGQRFALPSCGGISDSSVHPVLGGLHLAWTSVVGLGQPRATKRLCAVDVLSGELRVTPVPADARIVGADDTRFRVVLLAELAVLVVDTPGAAPRSIDVSAAGPGVLAARFAYASGAGRLVGAYYGDGRPPLGPTPAALTIVTVDVDSGTVHLGSPVERWLFPPIAVAVDRDGTHLYVTPADEVHTGNWSATRSLAAVRTSDATLVAATNVEGASDWGRTSLLLDEEAQRLFFASYGGITAFDRRTLATLGLFDAPRTRLLPSPGYESSGIGFAIDFSRSSGRLFVQEHEVEYRRNYSGPRCTRSAMFAVDGRSGRAATTDLAALYGRPLCSAFATLLIPAPPAPTGLSAAASGGQVTLSWNATPGATHYAVEAGTAPGLANLGRLGTGGPGLSVNGVPPGVFYVRVRAVGLGGQGQRSADLAVTVP